MRSMRLWFLLALAPLAACAPTGGGDDDDDAVDDGPPADPDVNNEIPEGYAAEAPARIIFVGDSITAGVGASSGGLAYPELLVDNDGDEWPDHDDIDLDSVFGGVEVVDVSVGGATTDSVLSGQLPNLSGQLGASVSGETVVAMTIGGNDMQARMLAILNGGDSVAAEVIDEVQGRLHEIVDYFDDSDRFPDGVKFFFTNVYEPTDGRGQYSECLFGIDIGPILHNFDQANDAFREVATDRDVAMLDLRGHFLGHGYYYDDEDLPQYHAEDPTLWFAPDCIHPNDRGHHELRRLFLHAMAGEALPLEPVPDESGE